MRPGGQDQPIASWAIASVIAEVCARAGIPYDALDFELVEGGVDGMEAVGAWKEDKEFTPRPKKVVAEVAEVTEA